ncbi:MAG: hypothetical protein RLZZ297_947 [Chloroflexota bacterium]|jgi:hypothetical protein
MRAVIRAAAIAALLAAVGNVVVFFIGTAMTGPMAVTMPAPMEVSFVQPFVSTLMFGLLGTLIVSAIALRTANPQRMWVILTVAGLVVYGIAPFSAADVTTAIWFNVMHVVAGVLLIPAVAKTLPTSR